MAVLIRGILLFICAACGQLGGEGGGDENLPNLGAGPFAPLQDPTAATPLREPFVLSQTDTDFGEPEITVLDIGYRLWFVTDGTIMTAEWNSLKERPGPPAIAIAPDQAYEGASVGGPSVVAHPDGWLMLYHTGNGFVAYARSSDGLSWTKGGPLLGSASHPAAIWADGVLQVYYTRPGRPGVYLAKGSLERGLTEHGKVFEGAGPALWYREERDHFGLYYYRPNTAAVDKIGFAGSFGGDAFVELANNPILQGDDDGERNPAVAGDVLLYETTALGRRAIAGASLVR